MSRIGRRVLGERVADLIASTGVDVVELEESWGWGAGLAQAPPALVVALHGPWFIHGALAGEDSGRRSFRARVRAEGAAIRSADLVLAPSEAVARWTARYYGRCAGTDAVIPYAIQRTSENQRWSLERCARNEILFVGRFDSHKGGDIAIAAFALLRRRRPDARLTFVGPDRGWVDAAGERWTLASYVESQIPGGLSSGSVVIEGQLAPTEVEERRRRAFVTISCSRWENLSLAVLEAMASGCPIVIADQGGLIEHVTDGVNGLVFRAGDAQDLARCLDRLMNDPQLARSVGNAAQDYVERVMAPSVVAARRVEAYRHAISNRRQRKLP